jgi:4-hydroxy-3-methylbut-2-en-1-yl diphosphate synthase IspG/GcpE
MDVSVIGCKVNGPGEAKEADIGVVGASRVHWSIVMVKKPFN